MAIKAACAFFLSIYMIVLTPYIYIAHVKIK